MIDKQGTYEIVLDADGNTTSIKRNGTPLDIKPDDALPSGPLLPGPHLGKIYIFEGNPTRPFCVKRFGKWW
jgi:hypothetical protein